MKVKIKLSKKMFKKKNELIDEVFTLWNSIEPEYCQKLILSMKSRALESLRNKGSHTSF